MLTILPNNAFSLSDAAKYRTGALFALLAIVLMVTSQLTATPTASQSGVGESVTTVGGSNAKATQSDVFASNVQAGQDDSTQQDTSGNGKPTPSTGKPSAAASATSQSDATTRPSLVLSTSSVTVAVNNTSTQTVTAQLSNGQNVSLPQTLLCTNPGTVSLKAVSRTPTSVTYVAKAERHAPLGACTIVVEGSVYTKGQMDYFKTAATVTVNVTDTPHFYGRADGPTEVHVASGVVRLPFSIQRQAGHSAPLDVSAQQYGPGVISHRFANDSGELTVDLGNDPAPGRYLYTVVVADNSGGFDFSTGKSNNVQFTLVVFVE